MKHLLFTLIAILTFTLSTKAQPNSPYQPDFNNKNYDKVIEIAQEQLKINPKDSMANYFMGFSYSNLKQHKKAITNLEIVKESGLIGPAILLRLAQSYTAENQTENALVQLEKLDSMQFGFYKRLDQQEFDALRNNKRFLKVRENMYKRANPCKFNESYRQFDFWLGEWDVYVQNQKIAESSITNTNGDCGILENWRPLGSNGGNSISYYDVNDKTWKQNWVAAGGVSHYEQPKTETNGDMLMIAKGNGVWYRMTWYYNKNDDTVRQVQESSSDQGQTWTNAFDGLYKRKSE
ncbi:hypothetical protein [uncultured Psychroserpens sp.]|uniref:tetratricopeptide repeat protein n=1 Tax=uncultured Psychroserpens sp. TaxID=255436 RepID=UPI0026228DD4|nr:hypothetical protein [uncultured Psychroserpens sp.]